MFELQENDGHAHSLRFEGEELLFQPDGPVYVRRILRRGMGRNAHHVETCETDLPVHGRVFFPDHGEAWRTPWRKVFKERAIPYRFERRIAQRDAALVVEYGFNNLGPAPVPCFWAMHPVPVGSPDPPDEPVRLTQAPPFRNRGSFAYIGPLHAGETLKYCYDRPVEKTYFFPAGDVSYCRSNVPTYRYTWACGKTPAAGAAGSISTPSFRPPATTPPSAPEP